MSKGKGKAGSGGPGGGPSTKAAAAAGSSGQGSSGQGSNRPSASSARPIGFRTEPAVQAAPPLAAEAAGSAQLTEPQSAGGSTKKDKEKLRKERQRQRKTEEAWEALRGAMELMGGDCGRRGSGGGGDASCGDA
jgi:hypothetical protein